MGKISNAIRLHEILKDGRVHNRAELSERLEVTLRMISIYIEELEKAHIPIEHIMGRYGGYRLYKL